MPTTPNPDPDEDDRHDDLPPPEPVYYSEQALLGALLLEPHRHRDVTGIGAGSFSYAAHGAVFTAISTLPAPDPVQHAQNTTWLNQVLAAAREQARGLTGPYLHTLISACPQPRHAAAYARMVEADHARRTLRGQAQHLAQTAIDPTLPHPVPKVFAEADALAEIAHNLGVRFPPRPGSPPRAPAPPPHPHLDSRKEALDEERLLLATATTHPAEIEQMRWLTDRDFTDPLHGGLWTCLTSLNRRGAPIDPVTVLWEAQQRGLTTEIVPADLIHCLSVPAGSAAYCGERVLERAVLATAHEVGCRIKAFTADPATTPYQLVLGSRRALADLSAVRTRWNHATSPATPAAKSARRSSSAPPRAGPPRTAAPPVRISR
ncbi:DnaB-like helicase N-terminal domain-containing protein [Streptomyces sp. JV176]|uniref:DnaB-like helicase N-terminal domain-containing protein n=1 Tax=Streptomyces sp. JV176 TaxID=858630 RepID=UPI002E763D8E|nr:DnaB-like helicase N-terminal domain-containing protein [Streptomyces sp. JV176]MEE1797416.1 DnaB-like helicase N-terminal domain-containing protein [Streptomyces sp. JV176]